MAPTGHIETILPSRRGPSLKELEVFTRQLALMTRAGIPIIEALSILKRQVKTSRFKASLNRLEESISDGGSIANGMLNEGSCFPKFYSTLTAAGERAGILDQALDTIANELKSRRTLRARMIRAAIYPTFVIATLAAIITFLLVCVVPTFEDLFNEGGIALPWLTQRVISLSRSITSAWLLMIVFPLLALPLLSWQARKSPLLVNTLALLASRIPIWRSLTSAKLACECSSLLASLTRVGIPIIEALMITSETIQNSVVKNDLRRICSEIVEGSSLSQAFKNSSYFPELFSNLIEAGESSGQLETMLSKAATLYREELEQSFELLQQLIEPVIVLAIGAVVGTVVLAIYMPIFQIGDLSGATNLSQR